VAEIKPLKKGDGSKIMQMGSADTIPVANMAAGGVLPLTSSYQFPVNCEPVIVDRITGKKFRIIMSNGFIDQEEVI
jgi:hypothetical protein